DVGHQRPKPAVVGAELLGGGIDAAVIRTTVPQSDQVPDLVHQGLVRIAAVDAERSPDRTETRDTGVDRDETPFAEIPARRASADGRARGVALLESRSATATRLMWLTVKDEIGASHARCRRE